jgi:Bacterial Ig-like domain (group 1)
MSKTRMPKTRRGQAAGVGLLVAAVVAVGLFVTAGAAEPTSGSVVPGVLEPQVPFTAGTPFSSGQVIDMSIPANSAFAAPNNNSGIIIVECSAPNGVVPTLPSSCDGNTQATLVGVNTDGSFTYNSYQVYSLPNSFSLGESASSPVDCGNTAATECVLYIGNNQNDFTQPHVWSQPFFVNTDPTDSGLVDPGDGSGAATATTPSASLSTAVASPSTATADGVDVSTVTVTLLGTGSVPISGKTVTVTPSSSTATVAPSGSTPGVTGANGQAVFTVTDTVAEAVTLTAVDTTDSVTLTQQPSVTFQAPVVSASASTVSASPSTVASGGSTTITVTLRDQGANPQPVAGQSVTLAGTGSAAITPTTPQTTNASGVVTFSATDPDAEVVTFTATDTTTSTVITNTAMVTFGTLTVSASQSTVTASEPTAPLGAAGTSIVVTLLSPTDSPVAGKTVSLSSTGSAVVGASTPSPAVTGANGQVSFVLTDQSAETVTLTATDVTDSLPLTAQPTVVFANGAPSATTSTVTAAATTAPADGETQTEISVTMKDTFGNALPGKVVTLAGAPNANVQIHPFSTSSTPAGTTDSSGLAVFEVDDESAETVTFTATDTTDSLTVAQTVAITFTAGAGDPSALGSTVVASPANPPADGSTPSTVTVTLTDYFGNPISGQTIKLAALNGSSQITPSSATTNQAGQAAFTVTDSTAEVVTYQATDVSDTTTSNVFVAEGVVTFGSPPVPPAVAAFCSVIVSPSSVPADGSTSATISVLLYDGNGDPLPGKAVTLSGSGGASKVTATNATTNSSGTATFAVTDTTTESVKYTADDTSDSVTLTAFPVTVTFTAAAAATTTTTSGSSTTTTTSSSSGSTSSTTTTAASGSVTSGASTSGNTGNTGASGTSGSSGSSGSLADTGASVLLPWLVGFGALFLVVGAIGRRRFNGRRNEA